jgi:membrane protein implicated in regulation of membrane protease activity
MQVFWDWLSDYAWMAWLGLAFIFGIVETTTLDLIFLMLAGGALGGSLTALVGLDPLFQALVSILLSIALLGFVRPIAKRHLQTSGSLQIGTAALIGRKGVVIKQVDAEGGLIKLAGEVWTARSYDGQSVIAAGKDVDVIEISGATALVFEVDSP